MDEITYNDLQLHFLQDYESLGGCVNTVILKCDEQNFEIYQLLKTAAVKGMEIIAADYNELFKARNPTRDISNYFSIKINDSIEPTGKYIFFSEFLGEGFDYEFDKLKLFTYYPERKSITQIVDDGFAHALLVPPHGLGIERQGSFADAEYEKSETEAYTTILKNYLSIILHINSYSHASELIIYEWSNDWSNFFDDGKEWWGTFYWTIYNKKRKEITIIAASTTD